MGLIIAAGCVQTQPAVHGIPNFGEVAPGIYRGGQPNAEGWQYLKSLGVWRVIKLNTRVEGADPENQFEIVRCPIPFLEQALLQPPAGTIRQAVTAIQPGTFIHCSHGQDRTGLVVAEYRVCRCGWTARAARDEMLRHGFHEELIGLAGFWNNHHSGNSGELK